MKTINFEELNVFDSINEDMPPMVSDHVDVYRDLLVANGHTVAPIDDYESEDWLAEEYDRATGY